MEIHALAILGAKYIGKLIADSKTFNTTKENALAKSWVWVKQHVFKNNPMLEENITKIESNDEKENVLEKELSVLLKSDKFKGEFQEWIMSLQSTPTIKNYFEGITGNIKGSVTIGDKNKNGHTSKNEQFKIKNVAKGTFGNIGGDFRVGDTNE